MFSKILQCNVYLFPKMTLKKPTHTADNKQNTRRILKINKEIIEKVEMQRIFNEIEKTTTFLRCDHQKLFCPSTNTALE